MIKVTNCCYCTIIIILALLLHWARIRTYNYVHGDSVDGIVQTPRSRGTGVILVALELM